MTSKNKSLKLFNMPIEVGVRSLMILFANSDKVFDLEKLMYFDYLSLHTSDIGGPASIHASIPNRGIQVYSKKELIKKGLLILLSKELIDFKPTNEGFMYGINEAGKIFLSLFQTKYFKELMTRIEWVSLKYGSYPNSEIKRLIDLNIGKWGSEFIVSNNLDEL